MNKKSIQEIKNKIPELPNSYFNPFPFSFIVNMKHTQSVYNHIDKHDNKNE